LAARITRRPPRVLFAPRSDQQQPPAIRFQSCTSVAGLPDLNTCTLEQGLWETWQAILRMPRNF